MKFCERLAAAVLFAGMALAYQKGAPNAAHPPAGRAARRGGAPGVVAKGPRLTNPANPAARLYRATPEERDRALEKLPHAQQERFRQNLKWFDSLAKEQQELVLRQVDRFSSLPPERQSALAGQLRALNALPPDRRAAVRGALRRFQMLSPEDRETVMGSDAFKNRFSAEEQKMIQELSGVM